MDLLKKLKDAFENKSLTSIDAPLDGMSCAYKDGRLSNEEALIGVKSNSGFKLKVFVSSICGIDKYDRVRINLKAAIENTGIAEVYLFEDEGASTLTAGHHFLWALEECDVCIFLIDNKDGVTPGVQKEIDKVRKNKIKSLFYFCDEQSKDKTALEKSLQGSSFAKSKLIHKFEEVGENGFNDLINDILLVYHYYCKGKFDVSGDEQEKKQANIARLDPLDEQVSAPKSILSCNIKTREFILRWALGWKGTQRQNQATDELDEWSTRFLEVLFEAKSIKEFNLDLLLADLSKHHPKETMAIVSLRWRAIQKYYLNDTEKCVEFLNQALILAKATGQADWIIKDILIDLRNMHFINCEVTNTFSIPEAQKELTESENEVYYPVMDRLREDLDELYLKEIYNKRIESANVIKLGSSAEKCAESLAKIFIIAIYYGSLTHILLFYEQMQNYLQYLIDNHNDWGCRVKSLALVILDRKTSTVEKTTSSNQLLLDNISSDDASFIMKFCDIHPLAYRRFQSRLIAMGTVGYLLDDADYRLYETEILSDINKWLNDENMIIACGDDIFYCLSRISLRISQDAIIKVCSSFIEKRLRRWYTQLFKCMGVSVNIGNCDRAAAEHLIELLIEVLNDEKDRVQISYAPDFLCKFRKQDKDLTECLDSKIKEVFPEYYSGVYHMETAYEPDKDAEEIITKYIEGIKDRNITQGKHGVYKGFATREIATIRNLISDGNTELKNETYDELISTLRDTLMFSRESISTKVDAVSLLACIIVKYSDAYERNKAIFTELFDKRFEYEDAEQSLFLSNIDTVALKVSLCVLFSLMDCDVYGDFIECLALVKDSRANILEISRFFYEYYHLGDNTRLPDEIESVLLQIVLQWKQMGDLNICAYATRLLFALLRNEKNKKLINHTLIKMIDENSVYIKNIIQRHIYDKGITEQTREYILAKCKMDNNYVVRKVYNEMLNTQEML